MPKFNHAFTLAFSVETDHEAEHVTAEEMLIGLLVRIAHLQADGEMMVWSSKGWM